MRSHLMELVKNLVEMKLNGPANSSRTWNLLWLVFLFNLLIMANAVNLGFSHTTVAWRFLSLMPLRVGGDSRASESSSLESTTNHHLPPGLGPPGYPTAASIKRLNLVRQDCTLNASILRLNAITRRALYQPDPNHRYPPPPGPSAGNG